MKKIKRLGSLTLDQFMKNFQHLDNCSTCKYAKTDCQNLCELADTIEKNHYLNDKFEVEITNKKSKSEKPKTIGGKQ